MEEYLDPSIHFRNKTLLTVVKNYTNADIKVCCFSLILFLYHVPNILSRSSHSEVFSEKGLTSATLLKKRLWYRCLPVNFAKFIRTPAFFYKTPLLAASFYPRLQFKAINNNHPDGKIVEISCFRATSSNSGRAIRVLFYCINCYLHDLSAFCYSFHNNKDHSLL